MDNWNDPIWVKQYKHDHYLKNKKRYNSLNRKYRKIHEKEIKLYDNLRYKLDPERKRKNDEYRKNHPQYMKIWHKIDYAKNKESILKNNKEWRINNPDKVRSMNEKYLKSSGLTLRQFTWGLYHWGKSVKERDNYTCWVCGINQKLIAHHILPKSKYPQKVFDINNGITLCEECHKKLHNVIGWR